MWPISAGRDHTSTIRLGFTFPTYQGITEQVKTSPYCRFPRPSKVRLKKCTHRQWCLTNIKSTRSENLHFLLCPFTLPYLTFQKDFTHSVLPFKKVKVLIAQFCPTLCDPMGCSPSGSPVHAVLQARILDWVAIPSSRGPSNPGLSHCRWILYHLSHQGSPNLLLRCP